MEKVKLIKRFGAYVIDAIFVLLVISLVSNIRFINPKYDKYMETYNKYIELSTDYINQDIKEDEYVKEANTLYYDMTKYSLPNNIASIAIILLYFGVFQKFNKGQTIGKKLMKIKLVSNNDKELTLIQVILRYSIIYLIEIGSVITTLLSIILVFIINVKYFMIVMGVINVIIMIISIISYVMIMVRSDNRGLHDLICKTKVINE